MVKAEAPGIDPDNDVDITLAGNQLQITVRREEKSEHKDREGYRSEFRFGTFSRTVSLPAPVNQEDISASYTDGVLEVRVPLAAEPAAGGRRSASPAVPELAALHGTWGRSPRARVSVAPRLAAQPW